MSTDYKSYYNQVYSNYPQYNDQNNSPGLRLAKTKECLYWLRSPVVDIGCGKQQAMTFLKSKGFKARGYDVVDLGPGMEVADITQPMNIGGCASVFCTDVLEHLNEKDIPQALANVSKAPRQLFRVSCKHSKEYCGQAAHLTVKPPAWWVGSVSKYAWIRDAFTDAKGDVIIFSVKKTPGKALGAPIADIEEHCNRIYDTEDLIEAPEFVRQAIESIVRNRRAVEKKDSEETKSTCTDLRDNICANRSFLLRELSTRWLISVADTFLLGGTPMEQALAGTLVTFGNLLKTADTLAIHTKAFDKPNYLSDGQSEPVKEGKYLVNLKNRVSATMKDFPHLKLVYEALWLRARFNSPTFKWINKKKRVFAGVKGL